MRSFARAVAFVGLVVGPGCSNPSAPNCPNDLPASCPSPAPTFSADVAPLIQNHCAGCHSADGEEFKTPLGSYDSITSSMQMTRTVEDQVFHCKMPPVEQPQLTSEERQTILGWFICGAKND